MRKGEKGIFALMAVVIVVFFFINQYRQSQEEGEDPGIPFYSTADAKLQEEGSKLYKKYDCRDCHVIWGIRNPMQSVPSPSLDGIGSLKTEEWLFDYLSAESPQEIVPSRLKLEYQMPSFADLPEDERRILARYFSSLKVEDWYLENVKKAEYEKLTGKSYQEKADLEKADVSPD